MPTRDARPARLARLRITATVGRCAAHARRLVSPRSSPIPWTTFAAVCVERVRRLLTLLVLVAGALALEHAKHLVGA